MGDKVVISGISGTFPNATNVSTFCDNLLNKVDMVTADNRGWNPISLLPERSGKILDAEKFDQGFFGATNLQSDYMDPMTRKLLEKAIEAIMDAGYHPSDLEGTNTAIINGYIYGDTERYVFYESQTPSADPITGNQRSILPKRISYHLKLNGKVFVTDSACSSSLYAVEHASTMIRDGLCDKALVCGTNLCLNTKATIEFARFGVLSPEGACRTFDNDANGYVRSDGVVAILLERRKDAKRVYAEVIHAKTNCDGYKNEGITHPLADLQGVLMKEFYNECKVDPTSVTFVEAHGTGTQVGDPEELKAIDSIFCKGRDKPLHVGSVKSNIGHTEATSALSSIIKVIISMETGYIPPNIHHKTPRKGVEALEKRRLVVATEMLPLPDNRGLFAVNSFGIGGANAHALLFWNTKLKVNSGQPYDDLHRLICVSSRTAEGVHTILDDFKTCDAEYAYLIQEVFKRPFENHLYRGFGIFNKEGELKRSSVKVQLTVKKLYLVFSHFDKDCLKFGSEFMMLPAFAKTIENIHSILFRETGINLLDVIKNPIEENFTNQILISAAIQISFANILKEINLIACHIVGFGSGAVVAAYADDCLTLKQTVVTLLHIASNCNNSSNKNEQILKYISLLRKNGNEKWARRHELDLGQNLLKYLIANFANTTKEWDLKKLLTKDAVSLIIGTGIDDISEINKVYLTDPNSKDLIQDFLSTLGRLYEYGFDMELYKLYPTVELPVSRGTPMLSPLIKWNHLRDCYVHNYEDQAETKSGQRIVHVFPKADEWNFITGHIIDGRNLFPATGYLYLVWETLAKMTNRIFSEMKIVFEDVRFLRASNLPSEDALVLNIMIQSSSGIFEIMEGEDTIVTGRVFEKSNQHTFSNLQIQAFEDDLCLTQTDVYKEFRLQGYNFRDLFRGIQRSTLDASKVIIKWNGNWIAFMDSLLQVFLLQQDSRNTHLPTSIHQLMIDAPKFLNVAVNQSMIHAESRRSLGILNADGIEVRTVNACTIPRKKTAIPVLKTYKFFANESVCNIENSVRVLMQFVLENSDTFKFKVVEVCSDEMDQEQLLCPLVQKILRDMPLVQEDLLVLSNKPMELSDITVQKQSLRTYPSCLILIVPSLLESSELFVALNAIKTMRGFIISRETLNADLSKFNDSPLAVLCSHKTNEEILVLLRPLRRSLNEALTIDITNSIDDFQWIPKLQELLKKNDRIIIYTQNDEISGILGLLNCLRKEQYGDKLSTVFIIDEAPKFDPKLDFYKKQLDKMLFINVWKDGTWGTYRHLQLPQTQTVQREHCYANITVRGDLSTMTWFEGNLREDDPVVPERELIHIYYSALNFRDVMTASGKIPPEIITKSRVEQECILGVEFSGRDTKGRRVMGICQAGSLATLVQCDQYSIYPIPDDWTMEDAATVSVVYATVIQAFNRSSQPVPGQSILIHSGTGGVGQAAINLSLYFGLTVFVTVGTQEKRDFIKQHYPQIKEEHIGNSRNTSFESMIRRHTNGKGVDFVLNSLVEEKLLASVRCLAKGGKFIEIGKSDIVNNNELVLHLLGKEARFIGLGADKFTLLANSDDKKTYHDQFMDLIKRNAIKPLPTTIFSTDEVEKAFRYMGQGKHIGKVLIKIRDEEKQKQCPVHRTLFKALPRFFCISTCSYVILGGLGGFGLELADFLVLRGARKLVLVSRSGISNGYQRYRMRVWKSYGVEVLISTYNISMEENCAKLLKIANELGSVDAIFNLAIVLKDALFDNQTIDDFKTVFSPKVFGAKYLDKVSRKLCPDLRYFVVFSSFTTGRGNAGQTNYAMANSIMERICEKRKKEGYPALAIQWGAIGDVGALVKEEEDYDNDKVIIGTHQQRISSCLQLLDRFLLQEEIIVSSTLVAQTKYSNKAGNAVDFVLDIIGITNINTISMYSTLPELGMDSIMAIEIKQALEKDYEIFLTGQDIKTMSLKKLQDLSDARGIQTTTRAGNEIDIPLYIELWLPYMSNERNANIPVLKLKTLAQDDEDSPHIFALPGLEGAPTVLEPLCKNLKSHVSCLQFHTGNNRETVSEMAKSLLPYVLSSNGDLIILAYSFGCIIATELLHLLALKDRRVKVIYIDGSPDLFRNLLTQHLASDDENFQIMFLAQLVAPYMMYGDVMRHKSNILRYKKFEEKLDYVIGLLDEGKIPQYYKEACVSIYKNLMALCEYKPKMNKLKFRVTLFKPTKAILTEISPDYNLSSLFENRIEICNVEGTHVTMLESDDLARRINKICRSGW